MHPPSSPRHGHTLSRRRRGPPVRVAIFRATLGGDPAAPFSSREQCWVQTPRPKIESAERRSPYGRPALSHGGSGPSYSRERVRRTLLAARCQALFVDAASLGPVDTAGPSAAERGPGSRAAGGHPARRFLSVEESSLQRAIRVGL